MKNNHREILIFYNPESPAHKRTVAHAMSLTKHIKAYPYAKTSATDMSWKKFLQLLNMHPRDLMNKATDYYQLHVRGRDFDQEGWLKVLRYNPEILIAPIAIRGEKAVLCLRPTDVHQLFEGIEVPDTQDPQA